MTASFSFRPARSIHERHGLFVALAGGTNSGKSFSAMRLARGIAGPSGKVAAVDTEGGRILHLKSHFDFDVMMMDAPHRPERYAEAARTAEEAGYDCVVIDSFSMEWVGLGGVLDWQDAEFQRMGGQEKHKLASWIKPKVSHKAMVYSLLQRRIPVVFSMRAEEKAKKVGNDVKAEWAPIQNKTFPFEVTVSFMLMQNRQGVVDLSLPHKMEGDHRAIFRDGDQLSEEHGARLAAWARGDAAPAPAAPPKPKWVERMEEMLAELDAVQDGQQMMAAIDKWRTARDWLRVNQPEASEEVEAAFAAAYQVHMKPGDGA